MRTIFPMIKVIDDVEKYAKPSYWILNYSNPASIVSEACRKLRPNARIINICDMPIAIIDVVAAAMGIKDKKNIAAAVKLLRDGGYDGWYSLEWEGVWRKEIQGPDYPPGGAVADFVRLMHTLENRERV